MPASSDPRKIVDTVADNGAAAGIVIGGRPVGPTEVDLRWVGGIMYRNAEIEETGVAAGVLGHPALGVAWLANKLGSHGVTLAPGPPRARRIVHPRGVRPQGRHAARRFRRARRHCGPVRVKVGGMELPRNSFKHAIAAGKLQIGLWCSLCSNDRGRQWCAIPGSTGCCSTASIRPTKFPIFWRSSRCSAGNGATAIVRPAWNDTVLIKRCLDIGAQTLLVPYVQNCRGGGAAVAAVRYPTSGVRGVAVSEPGQPLRPGHRLSQQCSSGDLPPGPGRNRRGARNSSRRSRRSRASTAFSSVRQDLSASLGHIGNPAHPEVQKALEDAIRKLKAIGKPAGILTGNEDEIRRYIGWGYSFVAVGSDLGLLRAADALATKYEV